MQKTYNLYNLEAKFKPYLISEGYTGITIRGYLSDLRYFLGWLSHRLNKGNDLEAKDEIEVLPQILTSEAIQSFKDELIQENLPLKTINRRLSTIRKFCAFCITQQWLTENPVKDITNHSQSTNIRLNDLYTSITQLRGDLAQEGKTDEEIDQISLDIGEFMKAYSSLTQDQK